MTVLDDIPEDMRSGDPRTDHYVLRLARAQSAVLLAAKDWADTGNDVHLRAAVESLRDVEIAIRIASMLPWEAALEATE